MRTYLKALSKRLIGDRGGQSMAFIAIILFTLVCFIAITINVGVFVSYKIHTQGLADSSALSGAVWQSRGLNIIKLLNQMINVAITHISAEFAQWVYWDALCAECIAERGWLSFTCFFPDEACFNALVEFDDLLDEQDAVQDHIQTCNEIQKMLAEYAVPLSAIFSIEYVSFSMNDADAMLPYVNFVAGSGDFSDSTTGGLLYYLYPSLGIQEYEHGFHFALWAEYDHIILSHDEDYPDKQWIATMSRYRYRPEILFDAEYNPGGDGYWALAQARPFGDNPDLGRSWFDTLDACNWDVKLMPFTADNQLASQLGAVPAWLISAASDLFILH